MFPCFLHSTSYKVLFILVLLFVTLEYLLNSVGDPRNAAFNNSTSYPVPNSSAYNPFFKRFVFRNYATNNTVSPAPRYSSVPPILIEFYGNSKSNLNYIITIPPFLLTNITAATSTINDAKKSVTEPNLLATQDFMAPMINNTENRPNCPEVSDYLYGKVKIIKEPTPSAYDLEFRFRWLKSGGHWSPIWCQAESKIALVIPFRNRGEHLLLFLQHMHPFLRKQQLDYTIFVVEQDGDGLFNRAMLMNVGYVEALKRQRFDCFIFHDIDLLPEDDRNLYTCPQQPRHMSVAVDVFHYKLPYPAIFGGVSAISTKHFQLLNGFSNSFWGWGGEDDDMSNRIRHHRLNISRYPITIARYTMLTHKKDKANPKRYEVLKSGSKRFENDGLNNLSYKLIDSKEKLLYTWILVQLPVPETS